ncbi:MAG: helix-turn-helix domain-containing protein [Rubritepida sp.]|nr:helix-turn-helix domain-containing protein [Rubritepida sp.]
MDHHTTGIVQHRFSTEALPAHAQFEAWRQHNCAWTDVAAPEDPRQGFLGTHATWHFGPFALVRSAAEGAAGRRDARRARRDQLDHLAIQVWHGGEASGRSADSEYRIREGDPHLFSLAVPGDWRRSRSEWSTLFIARDALPGVARHFDAARGRALGSPLGRLLGAHIGALSREAPAMSAMEAARAAEATIALVRAAVSGLAEELAAERQPVAAALRAQVLALIRTHLASSRLDPARLCRLTGMSRTALYRLFEPGGGVAHTILNERLRAAGKALADPLDRRAIGQIAEACGMPDPSVFSRAFRREFGVSPSAYRADVLAGRGALVAMGSVGGGFDAVLRRLRP